MSDEISPRVVDEWQSGSVPLKLVDGDACLQLEARPRSEWGPAREYFMDVELLSFAKVRISSLAAELKEARERISRIVEQHRAYTSGLRLRIAALDEERDSLRAEVERLMEQIRYDAPPCQACQDTGYPDPEGDVSLQWVCERCGERWAADDLVEFEHLSETATNSVTRNTGSQPSDSEESPEHADGEGECA